MVASTIMAILTIGMGALLTQFRSASQGGSARLEARAIHREVQGRVRLLLKSAAAPNEVDPALVWPVVGNSDASLRFHAPADLIEDVPFDPRTPDYPEFTLQADAATGGLSLQRSDATGARQLLGRGFQQVSFNRETDRVIRMDLVSQAQVRGASGNLKTVEERSSNRTLLNIDS